MPDQVFYLISAVLFGLVIGAIIMYFASGSKNKSDKTIVNLKQELKTYQHNVAEHFEQTAELIDDLTNSYKKVFDHLSTSARKLMTPEQIEKQIEQRKGNKIVLQYLADKTDDADTSLQAEETVNYSSDILETQSYSKTEASIEDNPEQQLDTDAELEKQVEMRQKNIYH